MCGFIVATALFDFIHCIIQGFLSAVSYSIPRPSGSSRPVTPTPSNLTGVLRCSPNHICNKARACLNTTSVLAVGAARLRLRVTVQKRWSRTLIWIVRATSPWARKRPVTDSVCRCNSAINSRGLMISSSKVTSRLSDLSDLAVTTSRSSSPLARAW